MTLEEYIEDFEHEETDELAFDGPPDFTSSQTLEDGAQDEEDDDA